MKNRHLDGQQWSAYTKAIEAKLEQNDKNKASIPLNVGISKLISNEARPTQPVYYAAHAKTNKLGATLSPEYSVKDEDESANFIHAKDVPSKGKHGKPYTFTEDENYWSYEP